MYCSATDMITDRIEMQNPVSQSITIYHSYTGDKEKDVIVE